MHLQSYRQQLLLKRKVNTGNESFPPEPAMSKTPTQHYWRKYHVCAKLFLAWAPAIIFIVRKHTFKCHSPAQKGKRTEEPPCLQHRAGIRPPALQSFPSASSAQPRLCHLGHPGTGMGGLAAWGLTVHVEAPGVEWEVEKPEKTATEHGTMAKGEPHTSKQGWTNSRTCAMSSATYGHCISTLNLVSSRD